MMISVELVSVIMPVIQIIIVKKSTYHQGLLIAGYMKFSYKMMMLWLNNL